MKTHIQQLVQQALSTLQQQGELPESKHLPQIDHTRDKQFGDYACNIALILAKEAGRKPRDIAKMLIDELPTSDKISNVDIAGPGFINFYLSDTALHSVIEEVLRAGEDFGRSEFGSNETINLEFVSANPTGPLHVGHGRSVAYGAACANLLEAVGYNVHREYYVNDAGRQMNILATSIWLRYLELCGESFDFPSNGYRGDYVQDIAKTIQKNHQDAFHWPAKEVFAGLPADETEPGVGDKEAHIDALIERAKEFLGETGYQTVLDHGLESVLSDIRQDLEETGLVYQEWFSERQLFNPDKVDECIQTLEAKGHTYKRDGCLWFNSTAFGDDKDRVLVRKNGQPTYFASDCAYHLSKFQRGAKRIIDILGADHHGYVSRIRAAVSALGYDAEAMTVLIVQFAVLYRGDEKVQMSTRSGSFITLRELRDEVGKDATRFFYVMRKAEQHLDFDLELAKSQSSDNPVYYIQYAHARICSVFRQLEEQGIPWVTEEGLDNFDLLMEAQEISLIHRLARYPETIHAAAINYEPHILAHYLRDLAQDLHTYYNAHQFIVDHESLRNARLALVAATRQVLASGMALLGISQPEVM